MTKGKYALAEQPADAPGSVWDSKNTLTMEQVRRMFPKARAGKDPKLAEANPALDCHTRDENCPACCGEDGMGHDVCQYTKVSPMRPIGAAR